MNGLVVSESATQRLWVKRALGSSWSLTDATNGISALNAVVHGDIQLVITDETAEPYGAFGLARELKQLEAAPQIIVLIERVQDQWLAKWSGADRWLVLPVDPFALADAVTEVTAGASGSRRRS